MRTVQTLLLLVALAALAESLKGFRNRRDNRDILVRSKRRWVLSTIEVEEEGKGPFPEKVSMMFNDRTAREGQIYKLSGEGVTDKPVGVFSINETSGQVYVHRSLDRETKDRYKIKFDILNKDTKLPIDNSLAFDIEIKDINDNAPQFFQPRMEVKLPENTKEGFLPVEISITDADQRNTSNSKITLTVLSQKPQKPPITFQKIDSRLSRLVLQGCFNYDKVKKYEIVLQAKDHGKVSLTSTAVVILNIGDANSHLPTFKAKNYNGEVLESTTKNDLLRVAVDDKDTPKTPGWKAVYEIIEGNKDGNYEIKTDPKTNEGILSVIKGKDFERTKMVNLLVNVKNEQPLFICDDKFVPVTDQTPVYDVANITIKVIDINDPPYYKKKHFDVYAKEEQNPGKVLFTPEVYDDDNDIKDIRHVLLEDPAEWVTIDEKTGAITAAKKMDRESPFVNDDSIYKVVIGSIDNGEPPATGTCTVLVHLGDLNDNSPQLLSNGVILCGNKETKVMIPAQDADIPPFAGPFAFALGDNDQKKLWKLDPANGEAAGLVCLRELAYDNYSVPLVIQDQQGAVTSDKVEVMVCDCGDGESCLPKAPPSTSLGPAGIGLIFLGLLSFLLLLLIFMCQCGKKEFQHLPMVQDEGNQTLIKYNQEGGGSECKSEPTLRTPTENINVTDGVKMGTMKMVQAAPAMAPERETYTSGFTMNHSNMTSQRRRDRIQSEGGANTYMSHRMNSYQGGSSRYNRSFSLRSNQIMADHIDRRMYMVEEKQVDHPVYRPYQYAYEGQGSRSQSLDQLSLSNLGDDLMFLNDLGPKFKTLAGICNQKDQDKNIQL
ncbi:cadherin-like protein 26 [Centropristis striata]|uniref:cadherin-like protein 26 n=1 Tax=Centropristis striata TaxID=184440 RepID=UPI0027E1D313|nr:cadherin-like protein 26 [Centropristis striata]